MKPMEFNQDNFEKEVRNSEQKVLVDFWADWCGPCKALGPVIDEVAKEMEGQVLVGKVNVDQEQELAKEYQVMSIPTLILYQNGKEVQRSVGVIPKEDILDMLS